MAAWWHYRNGTSVLMSNPGCMAYPHSRRSLLTNAEAAEYERLTAWLLAWMPPVPSFELSPAVRVEGAAVWHAYLAERIREGCWGQVQRSVYAELRRAAELFGGPR